MKKVSVSFIAVTLLLSMLMNITAIGAIPVKVQGTSCEKAYSLLYDLNILTDEFRADMNPEKTMTRAQFLALAIRVSGLDKVGGDTSKPIFSDVDVNHAYYKPIMTAAALGLISGNGEGSFNPNGKIEYTAALKIIITMLGYSAVAEARGGYPFGYLMVASEIHLLSGVTADVSKNTVTQGEVIRLLRNALDIRMMLPDATAGDVTKYSTDASETLLTKNHGIYTYEGILKGTKNILLSDVQRLKADKILIDGSIMNYSGKNIDDYIGMKVYYYYREESETVIALEPVNAVQNIIEVDGTDIGAFSDNYITYYSEDSKKNIKAYIASDADIVFNGKISPDITEADFKSNGSIIKLIDTNADSKYDIVLITKPENIVVEKSDSQRNTIYNKYDKSKNFHVDDLTDIEFNDEFGNNMSFSELCEFDVISVVKS